MDAGKAAPVRVTLVDYGAGNLHSVTNALRLLGAEVLLTSDPAEVARAERLVLPGVGAFGDCLEQLRARGLEAPIQAYLQSGKPFLGICVGMQMLFEASEESPGVQGLGFFKGTVQLLHTQEKIPQIGWNQLVCQAPSPLLAGADGHYVYFVHSYHCVPADASLVTAICDYGQEVVASVGRGPVQAVQFHPEKSGQVGLALLGRFLKM